MTDAIDTHETNNDISNDPALHAAAEPQPTSTEPASVTPDDVAPPLAAQLALIHAAVAKGASAEARAAGATACLSLATVLQAKPGQPLAVAPPQPPYSATSPATPIAALLKQPGFLTQLATMSREQLLDLLKQVTGAAPARTQSPSSGAPRFHLIQLPKVRRPSGGK